MSESLVAFENLAELFLFFCELESQMIDLTLLPPLL